MKKNQIVGFPIIAFGILLVLIMVTYEPNEKETQVYHITLANPELYQNGIFVDVFEISEGSYQFRFIPSGSSPRILSISLTGKTFTFTNDFELVGTIHETSISEYYTWDYSGTKEIHIFEDQQLTIKINPHKNFLGPVSLDLIPIT